MAESEFSFESDMADFIRENLRDNQRVRDKGTPDFSSRPIVSQTTTTFNETRLPLPAPFIPSGEVLGGSSPIPYEVSLVSTDGEPPTYEVTVGWGYVCERIPGPGNAIFLHSAPNTGERLPITVGQAVYVRVEVTEDGTVGGGEGDAVSIVVDEDEESSTHYIPKVDDGTSSGMAGHYLYKLAVLTGSEPPTLEKWLTGSHIDHYQELPSILTATAGGTGIGVIPKEWSDSEKAYKLRAISQKDPVTADPEVDPPVRGEDVQIHVEQETDRILIKGNGKGRVVKYQIGTETPVTVATFDDGLETEGTEEGNEIIIPIPAAAGGGLPEGSAGDILVHDGTEWVTLSAPEGTNLHVLGCTGGVVGWVETANCED
jgi:hypothetical protein